MPNFTQDWFSHNIPGMLHAMSHLTIKKRFLEIGCFEGRATCWFLRNALEDRGHMVCVDPFEGGLTQDGVDYRNIRERFQSNVDEAIKPDQKLRVFEDRSQHAMGVLLSEDWEFDFIYIDGSHTAPSVMTDACMAYELLRKGGVMLFDDYLMSPDWPILETPKMAVDMFTMLFREKVNIIMLNYQLAVQKIA